MRLLNFNKYLVSADGKSIEHFGSIAKPQSGKMVAAIQAALAGNAE